MGFTFNPTDVDIEIEGKVYKVHRGDVELQDRLEKAASEAAALTDEELRNQSIMHSYSDVMRELICAFLGQEAFDEVMGERSANFIQEAQLLAYIQQQIREANDKDNTFATALASIMGETDSIIDAD
jgi:hypothetical protein